MRIKLNNEEFSLKGSSIADLASELNLPAKGVAVAVGIDVIPRSQWGEHILKEDDEVMVIRASSGG